MYVKSYSSVEALWALWCFLFQHEMIHAYLFVTHNNRDREGHGPEFCKHMHRINKEAGTNITVSSYVWALFLQLNSHSVCVCDSGYELRQTQISKIWRASVNVLHITHSAHWVGVREFNFMHVFCLLPAVIVFVDLSEVLGKILESVLLWEYFAGSLW